MLQANEPSKSASCLKLCLFLSLSLFAWHIGIQAARATTWTVCQTPLPSEPPCDFTSIQTAISSSMVMNNDILEFPVNKEIYNETITLSKSLTFVGQTTTIDAQNGGTAVIITGNPTVVMQNMIIQNGSVSGNGGGIRLSGGDLTLTNVTLSSNDASGTGTGLGGGLYIASSGSEVQLTDVTIQTGTAVSGGGIYNNGTLTATNLTLTDNSATDGGGLFNSGSATVDESSIQRNEATASGGGIFNDTGASFTLENSDVSNNDAADGAGIANEGSLQLTNTNLGSGNVATDAGGGLFNSGQATLTNSTVVQNDGGTGAGIYNEDTLIANNSTLSRNEGANGAGLYNQSGTATLNNVTIHLTIGASLFANGGTVTVGNSILSSVSGQDACGGGGTVNSNGYNLANDQTCTFLSAANGDLEGIDPGLNGITSPTNGAAYHVPKLTSPVVDVGNPATPGSGGAACLASDQRGLARPQALGCDIGAVEIVVNRLYVPSMTR